MKSPPVLCLFLITCLTTSCETEGPPELVSIEATVVINRPVDVVFEFVTNRENLLQWATTLLEAKQTSRGPVDVGTTFKEVHRFFGRQLVFSFEVTDHKSNRESRFRSISGPMPIRGGYTFEPVEAGTRITLVFDVKLVGLSKLAKPILAIVAQRQWETNFANLKNLLEAHDSAGVARPGRRIQLAYSRTFHAGGWVSTSPNKATAARNIVDIRTWQGANGDPPARHRLGSTDRKRV